MITGLLLLPVLAILVWLYRYLLPGRAWKSVDWMILALVIVAAAGYVMFIESRSFEGGGPMWPQIVSVAGAYAILILGLAAGLLFRRKS